MEPGKKARAGFQPKKKPEVLNRIEKLMEDEVGGDPITGLKWTRKTTEKISRELKRFGMAVCANTVGRLPKKLSFSLKANHKKYEGNANLDPKDRDEQFRYIAEQRRFFTADVFPVAGVDAKKKELVGNFKNNEFAQKGFRIYGRRRQNTGKQIAFISRDRFVNNFIPYDPYDPHLLDHTVFWKTSGDAEENSCRPVW